MFEKRRRDRSDSTAAEHADSAEEADAASSRLRASASPAGVSTAGAIPTWAAEPPGTSSASAEPGRPLDALTRLDMEGELGHDLGHVRIHEGAQAQAEARALGADAFTVGADVAFAAGQYAPNDARGRHILAHELTHVLQQDTSSTADSLPAVSPQHSAAEREASAVAAQAASPRTAGPGPGSASAGHSRAQATPGIAPRGVVHRFDSFEHIQLGDSALGGPTGLILLDCHARDLPGHATPTVGWPAEWVALYARGTPEQRRAITQGLTYGEVIAYSGDMYASVDATNATSVVGTMDRINKASLREIYDLMPLLHSRSASTGQLERATGGRYIALASHNVSHFSNVSGGRNNISTWRDGHIAALRIAAAGDANGAWAMNAVADHFLTDAFAAGHLRPDRAHDVLSTSGQMNSKVLHDLDNDHGVAVHNLRGDPPWIQYGDDHLNDAADAQGLRLAIEAVQLSKADIQAALTGAAAGSPAAATPAMFPAEALVPIVDSWTANRWNAADKAAVIAGLAGSELPEQLTPNGDTRAREWVARQPAAALVDMPLEEKVRMVGRLLDGWVSGDDLDAIERLYRNSSATDKAALAVVIAPRIRSLISPWQQARLRRLIGTP